MSDLIIRWGYCKECGKKQLFGGTYGYDMTPGKYQRILKEINEAKANFICIDCKGDEVNDQEDSGRNP